MKVRSLAEPMLCQRISIQKVEWGTMDFHLQRRSLLDRAARIEEQARRERNAQARDLMRALALLYKEMAEELGESGLFERRFLALHFANLTGGDRSISAEQSRRRRDTYRTLRASG
jgi:hypothetical protein